jgi:hypothetical protein
VRTLVGAENLLNTVLKNTYDIVSLLQFAMAPIPTIWKNIQSQSKHIGYVKTLNSMGWKNPNSITLKENWVFVTNQFATACNYLLFMTIIGYFFNFFCILVVLATTLQLPCG